MLPEMLKVSILHGAGISNPALLNLVENSPQVRMVGSGQNPEEFMRQQQGEAADMILVYMDTDHSLPDWLESLTNSLPKTAVLLCSERMTPDFLLRAMRLGVREVLPLPLNPEDFIESVSRVRAARKRLSDVTTSLGKMLVVTGNKGGVGTTTVAVNLAVAMARMQSERVVLVDLGRPFPDVGNFLDQDPVHTIFDLIQNQEDLDHSFMEKAIQPYEQNLDVIHGISDFQDQDNLNLEGLQKVFSMLRTTFAWIVVDLSHWLDELFLQVVQQADSVLLLTELTVPDLRNLSHFWPLLRQWEFVQEKVKLVVNRYQRGNGLGLGNLEHVLKEKPYFTLPSDFQFVNEAINRGIPLVAVSPKSRLWLRLEELAQQITLVRKGKRAAASWRPLSFLGL